MGRFRSRRMPATTGEAGALAARYMAILRGEQLSSAVAAYELAAARASLEGGREKPQDSRAELVRVGEVVRAALRLALEDLHPTQLDDHHARLAHIHIMRALDCLEAHGIWHGLS